MSTSQQADPLIGRLVDGRYRVRARIARGGMATVYVATDLRLERRIALKVMHGHLSDDTVFQSRFIQEARAENARPHGAGAHTPRARHRSNRRRRPPGLNIVQPV